MNHYVCDRCANTWRAYRSRHCPACMHKALWEFSPTAGAAASALVRQIRDGRRERHYAHVPNGVERAV
jgi:DNA-directed RNA polymerase subunit RPC12/RpoP